MNPIKQKESNSMNGMISCSMPNINLIEPLLQERAELNPAVTKVIKNY